MKTAKLFKNGQSQAVRLPKEFRFRGDEVFIKQVGDLTILFSTEHPWNTFFASLNEFSNDFMSTREQPDQQQRDDMF
ncbi:MAG: antitoxin [Gammaproteobacteria bacterium]|nr:antitoxin [Gammaproteobacteria bacterium]